MDKKTRSTIEMNDPNSRPTIATKCNNMDEYDNIFVGFPIWWYVAPSIINTFLESYNLKSKYMEYLLVPILTICSLSYCPCNYSCSSKGSPSGSKKKVILGV